MRKKMWCALAALTVSAGLALPAAGASSEPYDNEPCSEEGACQNRSGSCRSVEKGGYCSDDDSVGPVIICVEDGSCRFGGGDEA